MILSPAEEHFLKTGLRLDGGKPSAKHKKVLEHRIKKKIAEIQEAIQILHEGGRDIKQETQRRSPTKIIKFNEEE